jgi:ABC-type multidrug transport system fused ATPase/permease subunit
MLALNPRLVLLTLIAFPPSVALTQRLKRRGKKLADEFHAIAREGSGAVEQFVAGIRTMRAFNGEELETRNWRRWNQRYSEVRANADLFHNLVRSMPADVINNVVLGMVFGYGAYEVIAGRLSLGSLVAFVAFIPRVYGAIRVLLDTQIDAAQAKSAVEHLDALFGLEPEREGGKTPVIADPAGASVDFRSVSFDYGRGDFNVHALTFHIEPGEFVGIVGTSGGGKTTLFDLLMGFYSPQKGSIAVDGLDLHEWSLASLREAIGLVPQDVFLWNRTLRDNVCYPKEAVAAEAVERAAEAGGISEWIEALPEGYETRGGVHGAGFSGGERQRIAISRAILRQPRLLLLDEATSALDALTELKVRDAIETARQGRTTMVIAHRLATVIHADRILVLAKGRICEAGAPKELLANKGLFYELYQAQKLDLHLSADPIMQERDAQSNG